MSVFLNVRVVNIRALTPIVREFSFAAIEDPLPGFSPGSHIQVHIPLEGRNLRNAYSLLDESASPHLYRIAVHRREKSRGGSHFLHDQLAIGDVVRISRPSNLFPVRADAGHHILIAGGIGITPFLAYAEYLDKFGSSFELHYAYRKGLTDAYVDELRNHYGDRIQFYDSNDSRRLDVLALLQRRSLGCHVYVCGPDRLLNGVIGQAQTLGWPDARIHWEIFSEAESGLPFRVALARSGQSIDITAGESLLEGLEANGMEIPNLCRSGACGLCATRYRHGEVEHRDHCLSAEARKNLLMPCVSRSRNHLLVLDL